MGNMTVVLAEETPAVEQGGELSPEEETPETDQTTAPDEVLEPSQEDNDIVMAFIQYLKDEYGAEYETYYNAIIEQWGSVKNYLNSKITDGTLTDETAEGWLGFVNWLDQYAVVWVPVLAGLALLGVVIGGRQIYKTIKNLFTRLFKGTNQNAVAQIAVIETLELLIGNSEKTKDARDKLAEAKKELLKNE